MYLLPMKQVASIISTYSSDVFGVCSALFELGGMTIIHDPSGCNSTYTTHDEPRWYDTDSLLYISGLTEIDAVTGNDDKLIYDTVQTARAQNPAFITLIGSPIPAMIGTDLPAIAEQIAQQTGLPTFSLPTNNMHSYIRGASLAFALLADNFVLPVTRRNHHSINILGMTPLDFSNNGSDLSIRNWLETQGWQVQSCWAMGSSLTAISTAAQASVNLVVSYSGLSAARILQKRFGIPYVIGTPIGPLQSTVLSALSMAITQNCCLNAYPQGLPTTLPKIVLIGESIYTESLAAALEISLHKPTRILCPLETENAMLRPQDAIAEDETDLIPRLADADIILADPMYQPICPPTAKFVRLPQEGFSGRLYRHQIPNLIRDYTTFIHKEL